jgi:hypothetical protein
MNEKFLAQGNNGLSQTGFEPTRSAIIRLLVLSTHPRYHSFGLDINCFFYFTLKFINAYMHLPIQQWGKF